MAEIALDKLYRDTPQFERDAKAYLPDPETISILKEIDEQTEIVVFLGTGYSESQREVAKFFKVMEEADNPNFKVAVYGPERTKQDASGDTVAHDIEFVPTIIIFQGHEELGRIVEYPEGTMESNLLDIIREHSAQH